MAAFAIAPGFFTPYDPLGFDFSALLALGDPAAGPSDSTVRTHARRGAGGRVSDALLRPWSAHGRVIVVLDPDAVPAARLAGGGGLGVGVIVTVAPEIPAFCR